VDRVAWLRTRPATVPCWTPAGGWRRAWCWSAPPAPGSPAGVPAGHRAPTGRPGLASTIWRRAGARAARRLSCVPALGELLALLGVLARPVGDELAAASRRRWRAVSAHGSAVAGRVGPETSTEAGNEASTEVSSRQRSRGHGPGTRTRERRRAPVKGGRGAGQQGLGPGGPRCVGKIDDPGLLGAARGSPRGRREQAEGWPASCTSAASARRGFLPSVGAPLLWSSHSPSTEHPQGTPAVWSAAARRIGRNPLGAGLVAPSARNVAPGWRPAGSGAMWPSSRSRRAVHTVLVEVPPCPPAGRLASSPGTLTCRPTKVRPYWASSMCSGAGPLVAVQDCQIARSPRRSGGSSGG